MKYYLAILCSIYFCIFAAFICNDAEDTIAHHYEDSIFDHGRDSYWYLDWTRKYIDGDPAKGRKKIWIIPIPAWYFDGWHLFKILRWIMIANALYLIWPSRKSWRSYIFFMILFLTVFQVTHEIFYEKVFVT